MRHTVDYDSVAAAYDRRYETNDFPGIEAVLRHFVGSDRADVGEVGCGTGHWLRHVEPRVEQAVGLDPSGGMLRQLRLVAPLLSVVRGRGEQLPWLSRSLDRIFCINALHHFDDADAFMSEARRVLRPGGGILLVGLDPHARVDTWWVYDYFRSTMPADCARFPSTDALRTRLRQAGFVRAETMVAQHVRESVPFGVAAERGHVDRRSTSQLLALSDAEWDEGLQRLRAEQPVLRCDVRLFATVAWVPASAQAR